LIYQAIIVILTYNAYDDSIDVSNDRSSHGTTVAGFIAALDNSVGTIGVAPQAELILIKMSDPNGYVWDEVIIKAFDKAIEENVDVINCSWGTYDVPAIIESKIQEAYDAGIVIVFAAGNDAWNLDAVGRDDESELNSVIGVGASDEYNDKSVYTNYGSNMDLLAPGGDSWDIIGLVGLDRMGSDGYSNQQGLLNSNYNFVDGSSFSAPQVAGVAALMLSVNPTLTPTQVRDIMIQSTQKIGLNAGADYNASGFDTYRAYGKIDASIAVQTAVSY
jgi:subtilisin family serine protease